MHNLEETYNNYLHQLTNAERFLLCYQAKLPEGVGHLIITDSGVSYTVTCKYISDDDHQRILQLFGEVFGRQGWEARLAYEGRAYDWTKYVDGIRIVIYDAQKCDQPQTFPVPPNSFPILLGNVQDSGQNSDTPSGVSNVSDLL